MDKQKASRAPLILAIVLLLLPVLYVGSYLALVTPGRFVFRLPTAAEIRAAQLGPTQTLGHVSGQHNYRFETRWLPSFFWPLEQVDRKVRPKAWEITIDSWLIQEYPE